MSFKLFLYYCALLGGWAAFVCWALTEAVGLRQLPSVYAVAGLTGGILGMLVAAAIGWLDALINAAGFERLQRVGLCAFLGLLGGSVGGLIGQVLNSLLHIPLFVGWIVAGVLIGASLGVFDLCRALAARERTGTSLKKIRNGIVGGFVGGFVGGLPFTFLIGNPTLPRSSLAVSLVILGMCIGLLIGLAEVILTEASLRVEEGFRAGRELLLTRNEITIGRAESCDLGLFGDSTVAKVHARIVLQNNRYMLAHQAESGETFVNRQEVMAGRPVPLRSGDRIRVGGCVLVFRERQTRN